MFPEANIFIDLRKSRLVGIGPDSPEWLKRFQAWGLPPTMVAESGGGEGHTHYYYRRPVNTQFSGSIAQMNLTFKLMVIW